MSKDSLFLPGLSPVEHHDIHARFDSGSLSSDGGVLLLRELENRLDFSGTLSSCLSDRRDGARTRHTYADMIRSRLFAICCGYEGIVMILMSYVMTRP